MPIAQLDPGDYATIYVKEPTAKTGQITSFFQKNGIPYQMRARSPLTEYFFRAENAKEEYPLTILARGSKEPHWFTGASKKDLREAAEYFKEAE